MRSSYWSKLTPCVASHTLSNRASSLTPPPRLFSPTTPSSSPPPPQGMNVIRPSLFPISLSELAGSLVRLGGRVSTALQQLSALDPQSSAALTTGCARYGKLMLVRPGGADGRAGQARGLPASGEAAATAWPSFVAPWRSSVGGGVCQLYLARGEAAASFTLAACLPACSPRALLPHSSPTPLRASPAPPLRPQRPASCLWENVGQMVVEQRKRAPPEAVEAFRQAALRVLEELGGQLEPLWQQLR